MHVRIKCAICPNKVQRRVVGKYIINDIGVNGTHDCTRRSTRRYKQFNFSNTEHLEQLILEIEIYR